MRLPKLSTLTAKIAMLALAFTVAHAALPLSPDPASAADGAILDIEKVAAASEASTADAYRLRYRSDGLAVVAYLVLPRQVQGRLPVLLFAHGGSGDADKIGMPVLEYLSKLSARGHYVVLATDYRGTPGSEGKDEFGGADVNDLLNLIPVAMKLPIADTHKLLMLGFSRGAIDTYVAIRRGTPLQAAAVVSGPADLAQTYRETGFFTRHSINRVIGGSPDEKPAAYRDRSALAWPEQLNVPLLILHGAKDDRIAVTEAEALDRKLSELGKPHRLLVFAEGKHMLHNVGEARDQAIIAWFNEHLGR